jgi:polyisoprenoid-binding protein YceI
MIRLALTLIFITLALPARATTWTVDTEHSNVLFHVRHFVSKVSGRFSDFGGSVVFDSDKTENNNILFEIRTESISTDHKVRDDHLRSAAFFYCDQYKKAIFKSNSIRPLGKGQFKIDGTLELRGVSKPVALDVEYLGTAKDLNGKNRSGFTAKTQIKRSDFGLTWNQFTDAGVPILGDDVELNFNIALIEITPLEATNKKTAQ